MVGQPFDKPNDIANKSEQIIVMICRKAGEVLHIVELFPLLLNLLIAPETDFQNLLNECD